MSLTWFCVWQGPGPRPLPLSPAEHQRLKALLSRCPGLREGLILTPTAAHDPHYADVAGSPSLILQLAFDNAAVLEAQLQPAGGLADLAAPDAWPSLASSSVSQQAMLTRHYAVPDAQLRSSDGSALTYWVEYAGPAQDDNAWHRHYVQHHVPLLTQLPGVRRIEVFTPAPVICGLDIPMRPCLQRNVAVFDNAKAMGEAMQSPVRAALRRDFEALPPFTGAALHHPFSSTRVLGPASVDPTP